MSVYNNLFKPVNEQMELGKQHLIVMLKIPEDHDNTRFPFFFAYVVRIDEKGMITEGWGKRFQSAFEPGKVRDYVMDYQTWNKCGIKDLDVLQGLRDNYGNLSVTL